MKIQKIKLSVLTALVVIAAGCSQNPGNRAPNESGVIAGNIVGGKNATNAFQKANGVVALVIRTADGQGLCSGSLISKRIVLTAAHCLDGSESAITSIAIVFTSDLSKVTKENVRFGVSGLPHELFLSSAGSKGAWYDVALLKLNEDAPADFKFAKLPSLIAAPLASGTQLIQAGFGLTEASRNSTTATSGVLKQVSGIEVLNVVQGGKELLLNENGKGSCNGDSGGPAFTKASDGQLTLVGIDSRGTDPNSCIGLGIYTNVSTHLKWIQTKSELLMAADAAPKPPAAN